MCYYKQLSLEPIIIAWVLRTLMESLLPCSYFSMHESSPLITRFSSSLVSEEYDIAVSSAYIVALAFFRANGKSLMYRRKRRGPRHDPCGTLNQHFDARSCAIDSTVLLPIIKIRTEPLVCTSSNSIKLHFI